MKAKIFQFRRLNGKVLFEGTAVEVSKYSGIKYSNIHSYAKRGTINKGEYYISETDREKSVICGRPTKEDSLKDKTRKERYELKGIKMDLIYGTSGKLVKTIFL